MTTIVCQNMVTSRFESHERAATLKLKVASDNEFGNWGFLQTSPKEKDLNSYTYTSQNSSFPISLDLCTENLGSETGSTDIITDTSIFSSSEKDLSTSRKRHVELESSRREKTDNSRKNFPPPLTSSLQVRRRREGGRLIIEAVEAPLRNTYLQAERSEGRLKLCFFTAALESRESEDDDDEALNESEWEFSEEMEINSEIGIEKFKWIGRCKENGHGNKGLCNSWKPALWVATS